MLVGEDQQKNSSIPSDVTSTQVAFNSVFINRLNWDTSLLVKRTRMEWENMSTLDSVNLANKFAYTLSEPPKSETTKIQHFKP